VEVVVLECVDVTEEFEDSCVKPGERIFRVKYVSPSGEVKERYVSYVPSWGYSPDRVTARLQKVCLEMAEH
jgi:hypothetical protein